MLEQDKRIIACKKCPRLSEYIRQVAIKKKREFSKDLYWGKPVPNFGDPNADLLIIGLAPAAHGANRTGRMFTGDRSGEWLYRALFRAGFSNLPVSTSASDDLRLKNCLITAVNHCAPPQNKPSREEIETCFPWLLETFHSFRGKAILALGRLAWTEIIRLLKQENIIDKKQKLEFSHSAFYPLNSRLAIFGSYHPSQQNTFTGKLTEPMFDEVFKSINHYLQNDH